MRPNLHVEDMVDAYHVMLTAPRRKDPRRDLQHRISESLDRRNRQSGEKGGRRGDAGEGEIKIVTTPTNDMRSYHVNSDKVKRVLGFTPKRSIEDAVRDLTRAFRNHLMPNSFDDDWYYNVRTMKKLGAK
jgi:nucleoside-diphosphate-sugar epimerase